MQTATRSARSKPEPGPRPRPVAGADVRPRPVAVVNIFVRREQYFEVCSFIITFLVSSEAEASESGRRMYLLRRNVL
jgi:hypothetical protein